MNDKIEQVNSIFEQPWWLNIVAPGRWNEVVIKENNEIIARLPYTMKDSLFNKRITMPKLTQTLGIWMNNRDALMGNTHLKYQKDIYKSLISQLPNNNDIRITLDSVNSYILPFRWMGFSITPSFSYRLDNINDLNTVYSNFSKTVKKNIKQSDKKVNISYKLDIDEFFYILELTFKHQNRKYPISKKLVTSILEACEKRKSGQFICAKDDNENIHACSYIVYDKNRAYYLLSGTNPKYRNSGAQSLVLEKAIEYSAQVSEMFDFEGSMIEGIENFMRQFGGKQVINYVVSRESLIYECAHLLMPRVKKFLGYKI